MFLGCLGVLIAVTGFITEIPPMISARLSSTNAVKGTFVMTKTDVTNARYVSCGTYEIVPHHHFRWCTLKPFETEFYATPTNYVYRNEDETITRDLATMDNFAELEGLSKGDYSAFFKSFDALYKTEQGKFYVKAKPKLKELKPLIERVEAEGVFTNWTLTITFPQKTIIAVEFKE